MDIVFLLIAVAAIIALWRGEGFGKTLKTWITRIVDAFSGAG
jgi:hypothetical protein